MKYKTQNWDSSNNCNSLRIEGEERNMDKD